MMELVKKENKKYFFNIEKREKYLIGKPPFSYEENNFIIMDLSPENLIRNFDDFVYENNFGQVEKYIDYIDEKDYEMLILSYRNKIYLYEENDNIYIKTPFEYKDKVKQIPSRKWDPEKKLWYCKNTNEARAAIEELFDVEIKHYLQESKENLLSTQITKDFPNMFPHQVRSVAKGLISMSKHKGFLIAHTTGTGKTFTSYGIAYYMLESGMVDKIVVTTNSPVVKQFHSEYEERDISGMTIYSGVGKDINNYKISESDVLITSHSSFRKKQIYTQYFNTPCLIIVDEASVIKGKKSLYPELVKIRKKNPNVYILSLTATPIENNLVDVFNILSVTVPNYLSYGEFIKRFGVMEEIFMRGGIKRKVLSKKDFRNTNQFLGRIRDVFDRKLSEEILDLPKNNIKTYLVKLTNEQKILKRYVNSIFNELKFSRKAEKGTLTLKENSLLSLIANSPATLIDNLKENEELGRDVRDPIKSQLYKALPNKIIEFYNKNDSVSKLELIGKVLDKIPRDKILIFTKYKRIVDALGDFIEEQYPDSIVLRISGEVNNKKKEEAIDIFKNSKQSVILISTDTFARGKNFQFCNYMINYDLPWNPAVVKQRIGRIKRIGSDDQKFVFNILSDPIELNIFDKIINKEEQAIESIEINKDVARERKVIQEVYNK